MPHINSLDAFGITPNAPLSSFPAKIAAIDLGSNSLRLVLYSVRGRYFYPEHNERIQCGLAYGMDENGKIDDQRLNAAKSALLRFLTVSRCRGAGHVIMFATSALRDASNSAEFLAWAKERSGYDLQVLSGDEEAVYAALGIVQACDAVNSVVADLGGGSLELCGIDNDKQLRAPTSLPLGPLRYVPDGTYNQARIEAASHAIASFPFHQHVGGKLYLVGGAFRNIAKFHILSRDYPIHIMDHYSVAPDKLRKTLKHLRQMTPDEALSYKALAKKRAPYIPYAAELLEILMTCTQTDEVVFSTSGVREGIVFSMLPEYKRLHKPEEAALTEMRSVMNIDGEYADALCETLDDIRRMCGISLMEMRFLCAFKEYTAYHYGDFRGDIVFHQTLYSPFMPLPHQRRVFITLALVSAYVTDSEEINALMGRTLKLLDLDQRRYAAIMGKALKAVRALSGNCPNALRLTRIYSDHAKRCIYVSYDVSMSAMMNTRTEKKIRSFAHFAGFKAVIEPLSSHNDT